MLKKIFLRFKFYFLIIFITSFTYLPILISYDRFAEDMNQIMVAQHHFITSEFRDGRIPFWFNLANFGQPSLFNGHYAFFNPLVFVFYILNYLFNFNLSPYFTYELRDYFSIVSCILSSFSFFFFVGKIFKDNKKDELLLIASLIYGSSTYNFVNSGMPYGLIQISVPAIFYYTLHFIHQNKITRLDYFGYVFFMYFAFTVGYPMYIFYLLGVQGLFLIYFRFKGLTKIFFMNIVSFGISSFILIPYIHQTLNFSRNQSFELNHNSFSLSILRLGNLINPYGGLDPVFGMNNFYTYLPAYSFGSIFLPFFILGVYKVYKDKQNYWIFLIGIIFILYSSGNYLKFIDFFSVYSTFILKIRSHWQGYSVLHFIFSLLIYIGMRNLFSLKALSHKVVKYALSFIGLIIIYILVSDSDLAKVDLISIWILAGAQIAIVYHFVSNHENYTYKFYLVFVLFFVYLNQASSISPFRNISNVNVPNNYTAKSYYSENIISKNISQDPNFITRFDATQLSANASHLYINSFHAYDANFPKSWMMFDKENLLNAGVKFLVTDKKIENKDYNLVKEVQNDGNLYSGQDFYIYSTNKALPKYFSPRSLKICAEIICKSDSNSLNSVRYNGYESLENNSENYSIKIIENNSMGVSLQIFSDSRRFIASRENMFPGWVLEINSNPAELFIVDEGFRGFFVESGTSEVKMSYFPYLLKESIILSIISLIILIIYINSENLINKIKSLNLTKKL